MTSLISGTAHSARRHRPVLASSDTGPPASDPIGPVPCSGGTSLMREKWVINKHTTSGRLVRIACINSAGL